MHGRDRAIDNRTKKDNKNLNVVDVVTIKE
jgi:hypothetical protein